MIGIVERTLDMVPAGTLRLMTFHGSSEESKPTDETVADGSIFWETDTGDFYRYDAANTTWRLS